MLFLHKLAERQLGTTQGSFPTDIEEMFVQNCSERRPRRSNSLQQRLSVIRERRGRRSLQL